MSERAKTWKTIFSHELSHLVLIAVLGLLIYSMTLHVPFQLDEEAFIADNPIVKDLDYFFSPSKAEGMDLYGALKSRYVGYLTFALNYALGGLDVRGYHLLNVVIHIATALLFYTLVLLSFRTPFLAGGTLAARSRAIALFSGLLFVAHPVQTEAITYIFQRLASLVSLFYLLSIVLYIRARFSSKTTSAIAFYSLSLISAILAMKTKENAFTLPVVIVLFEFLFFTGPVGKRLLRMVPLLLTLFIIPVTLAGVHNPAGEIIGNIAPATRGYHGLSRGDYFFTELRVIVTYIRLLFFPVHQNLDYDYPVFRSFWEPSVFLSFVSHCALVGFAVLLLYRSRTQERGIRLIAFGILWFYITLSVESSIVPIPMVIDEYRLYLPSAGAFMAVVTSVFLIAEKIRKEKIRNAVIACLVVISLMFAVAALKRNSVWLTNISLWEDVVSKSPFKARPHNNLGVVYARQGRIEDAVKEYLTAIRIKPDYYEAYNNLGEAYFQRGDAERAVSVYRTSIQIYPENALAHYNLGVIYSKQGRIGDAVKEYRTAIRIKPDYYKAHGNLGEAYFQRGDIENAITEFRTAIQIAPEYLDGRYNLGKGYARLGRIEDAIKEYLHVIRMNHDYDQAHVNLGVAYFKRGNTEEAIKEYLTAIRIAPGNAVVHYNLGIAYTKQGRIGDAITAYLKAIELNPDFYEAHYGLGVAYKMGGHLEKSAREFRAVIDHQPNHKAALRELQSIMNMK